MAERDVYEEQRDRLFGYGGRLHRWGIRRRVRRFEERGWPGSDWPKRHTGDKEAPPQRAESVTGAEPIRKDRHV